jgi:ABC-type lipoprotein release transport system permease subunit
MTIVRLALRNLWRNGRRTAIAIAAVALGLLLCISQANFGKGAWTHILDANIRDSAGHAVIQAKGYLADPDPKRAMAESAAKVAEVQRAAPEAKVLRRNFLGGLLSSPTNAVAVSMSGVEPVLERSVTELDDRLQEGEWLDDDKGVLIGVGLAHQLGVGLGDKVVFMAQGEGNELDSILYRVKGIYRTGGEAQDNFAAMATFASTQKFLPGVDPATQISVQISDWAYSEALTDSLRPIFPGDEVLSWKQALPELQEQAEMKRVQGRYTMSILLVLVAVGILNVQLMSVLERTRELGVLRAIGMRPGALAGMVILEGLFLGLVAVVVGLGLGSAATIPLATWGVDYGDMLQNVQSGGVMDPVVRADWDFEGMAFYAVVSLFLAIAATIWPAWRVTQLTPLDAMRHV